MKNLFSGKKGKRRNEHQIDRWIIYKLFSEYLHINKWFIALCEVRTHWKVRNRAPGDIIHHASVLLKCLKSWHTPVCMRVCVSACVRETRWVCFDSEVTEFLWLKTPSGTRVMFRSSQVASLSTSRFWVQSQTNISMGKFSRSSSTAAEQGLQDYSFQENENLERLFI